MMKNRIIISTVAFAASALALGGCTQGNEGNEYPDPQNRSIILPLSGLTTSQSGSRAPVDSWNNTPVSVGYTFSENSVIDRSLTVPVLDNNGGHINTGLAYPPNNSVVQFIGYHPVATPNTIGTVTYDLSKGNVDVMMSNSVSGSLNNTILSQGEKLVFKHLLTRVTFRLQCAENRYYPEPIFGLIATPSTSTLLGTAVTLDLADESVTFKIWSGVFAGNIEGFVIPQYGASPVIVEMMLQPDVPLAFTVSSLTGNRNISNVYDPDGLWDRLLTQGGEQGKQYTVELLFTGELILAEDITVTPWIAGGKYLNDGKTNWS